MRINPTTIRNGLAYYAMRTAKEMEMPLRPGLQTRIITEKEAFQDGIKTACLASNTPYNHLYQKMGMVAPPLKKDYPGYFLLGVVSAFVTMGLNEKEIKVITSPIFSAIKNMPMAYLERMTRYDIFTMEAGK